MPEEETSAIFITERSTSSNLQIKRQYVNAFKHKTYKY